MGGTEKKFSPFRVAGWSREKIFGPNFFQAKFGVFSFSLDMVCGGGGGGGSLGSKNQSCSEWSETHLVLEFLKSDEIFEISEVATSNQ